ncbi:MAG: hypothetical protein EBX99_03945 [Acidimicrobiia bacterium]|nr:hypothetical protein [Acidimicrobiia bacterium]
MFTVIATVIEPNSCPSTPRVRRNPHPTQRSPCLKNEWNHARRSAQRGHRRTNARKIMREKVGDVDGDEDLEDGDVTR